MTPEEIQPRTTVFLGMTAIIASDPMRRLMEQIERAAKSSAAILITGESGSGKEVAARAVHHFSHRSHRPWVDLSCAALPEHLLESELFGYDRGAFSGADHTKPGLFEMAHQGTLFLDEIGELDPRMQVKLLRVLDGVSYYRLGGTKKITADVRIVAASNQDLERMVAEGRFRGDLFHRLCQLTLRVPPLRERRDDIEMLAASFLGELSPPHALSKLSQPMLDMLRAHDWPGNVRELRNAVARLAVFPDLVHDVLDAAGPGAKGSADSKTPPFGALLALPLREAREQIVAQFEEAYVGAKLAEAGGNVARAGVAMGVSRQFAHRLVERLGLRDKRE